MLELQISLLFNWGVTLLSLLRNLFKLRHIKRNKPDISCINISLDEPLALQLISAAAKHKHIFNANIIYPSKPNIVSPNHVNTLVSFISSTTAKCLSFFLYQDLPSHIVESIFKALQERSTQEQASGANQGAFLPGKNSIENVSINLDGINDDNKLHHFTTYLRSSTTLRKFRLKADIDDSVNDLSSILVALQPNKYLHSICIDSFLSFSCLNDSHIFQLHEIVRNRELQKFSLSGHQLSTEAIDELCKELRLQRHLKSLNLASINCTDAQLASIRSLLKEENSSLQSLTVGQNFIREYANQMTQNGILDFLEGIKHSNTLKYLTIGYFDNDWLTTKLAAVIQENKGLESLTLKHSIHHPLSQHGIICLVEALKTNTTLLRFVEEQDNKTTIKFIENCKNVLLNRKISKGTVKQINYLLERNKLIKAIQADPNSLPYQLKKFRHATLDNTFFVTVFKVLPEPFLLKYDDLLTKLVIRSQTTWNLFKRNQYGAQRINHIISVLSQQAQAGDDVSKMTLGYIYKNGLLNQFIDPETAKDIFDSVILTSTKKEVINEAHFERGHLDLIYLASKDSRVEASNHFDKVATTGGGSTSTSIIATHLRDHCINHINSNSSIVLPDKSIIEKQLDNFRCLGSMATYFNSLGETLLKMAESSTAQHAGEYSIEAQNIQNEVSTLSSSRLTI